MRDEITNVKGKAMTKFSALRKTEGTNDNTAEDVQNLHEWLEKQDMFSKEDAMKIMQAQRSKK